MTNAIIKTTNSEMVMHPIPSSIQNRVSRASRVPMCKIMTYYNFSSAAIAVVIGINLVSHPNQLWLYNRVLLPTFDSVVSMWVYNGCHVDHCGLRGRHGVGPRVCVGAKPRRRHEIGPMR